MVHSCMSLLHSFFPCITSTLSAFSNTRSNRIIKPANGQRQVYYFLHPRLRWTQKKSNNNGNNTKLASQSLLPSPESRQNSIREQFQAKLRILLWELTAQNILLCLQPGHWLPIQTGQQLSGTVFEYSTIRCWNIMGRHL